MTSERQAQIRELADTALELYDEGTTNFTAKELAKRHYRGRTVGKVAVEEVRSFLSDVRKLLEQNDYTVVPLAQRYFDEYRGIDITLLVREDEKTDENEITYEDAVRHSVAVGSGKKEVGFAFVTPDDPAARAIWAEWLVRLGNQTEGRTVAGRVRLVRALESNILTVGQYLDLESGQTPRITWVTATNDDDEGDDPLLAITAG